MCSRWDSRHVLQVWRYNYFNNVAGSMETDELEWIVSWLER